MQERKQISIIVAVAENYGIGKDNKLLWHISEDLKRFKKITAGHTVIMGKNTYESLPFKPLRDRRNLVITDVPGEKIPMCEMAYSIAEAVEKMDTDSEYFVMGGASIYRQFFGIADKLYITKVQAVFEADTFFPEILDTEWTLVEESEEHTDPVNHLHYTFLVYTRKEK